jgi:hypothetical protein
MRLPVAVAMPQSQNFHRVSKGEWRGLAITHCRNAKRDPINELIGIGIEMRLQVQSNRREK